MQREEPSPKPKSAKQGYAAAAKLAGMKLYYGLLNRYGSGKAKNIELKTPEDEIIVLGRRFSAAIISPSDDDQDQRRCKSMAQPKVVEPEASDNTLDPYVSEDKPNFASAFQSDINYALPDPTMHFQLGKNKSVECSKSSDSLSEANEQLSSFMANVACFTYRSNWGDPIPNTRLFSDAGWGCMIRVGQMAFFNCIIRDQLLKEEDFIEDRLKFLLILFNDCLEGELAPFSIKNIVPYAFERFNIPMGNWFRATSIMMSLESLNKTYKPRHTSHIRMVTMLDGTFLLSKLYETLMDQSSQGLDEDRMLQELSKPWNEKRLIVTLTSMLGIDKPQIEYQKCLNFLLSQPSSVGILGGSDNRAYYIIGYNKAKKVYYYLDPHSVQVARL